MNKLVFRKLGFLLAGLFFLLPSSFSLGTPNIVLILADDFGRELLASYGGQSGYRTPNLDQLAKSGMQFNTCYATPLCVPSRVELLTGRYSFRNYMAWGAIDRSQKTFPQLLKAAGYKTAMAGKWHPHGQWELDPVPPVHAGYDEYCSYDSVSMGEQAKRGEGNRFWGGIIVRNGKEEQLDRYGPEVYSDFLVDFIKRNKEGPFLAYYAMTTMHRPFHPTADHPDAPKPGQAAPKEWLGANGSPDNFVPMLQYADKMVGKIIRTLDELGLSENTILIFTADNGTDNVSDAKTIRSRFMDQEVRGGKYFPVELGVNVPLLVQWTGQIKAGSICNELVDLTDFFPTFCDLANVPLPSGYPLDGRSILPLTQGTNRISKAFTFTWGNYENNSSKYKDPSHNTDKLLDVIRGPRYKFYSDGRLFDIRNDFLEEHPIGPGTSKESDKARIDLKASLEKLRTTQPRTW
ncbi:MAG: sulfatase-like hydrolase/transferase [Verrucomicrobia bacterium]|nr:sulfatase-like hydrolase/transferase [Verrucomicrobiota bacterium]